MPEPTPLDPAPYLDPISEGSPAGPFLRYVDDPDYLQVERAREEEEEETSDSSDIWRRNRKKADWESVISLGLKFLKGRSKDLEVAGWVAEALARRRGLAGVRDGLRLLRAVQDAFWDDAHPGGEDLELREGIYEFLDGDRLLPLLIRNVGLTEFPGQESYSLLKYRESREVENLIRSRPELEESLKTEGKIRAEAFDNAAEITDRAFYVRTLERLGECQEAVKELNASLKLPGRFKHPPTLTKTPVALEEVAKLAGQLLARKPAPEADPADDPEPVADDPVVDDEAGSSGSTPEESPGWDDSPPVAAPARPAPPRPKAARPSGGPISGPEDARDRIAAAAHHLRGLDAADPLPYLVVRSLGLGSLYRGPGAVDPSALPPPATEDRQALRRLAAEGSWAELLEQAEAILARPEGAGWLDAQRLALRALEELGHEAPSRAARALLGAGLRDYPDWPSTELDDMSPCAGAETRAWIERAFPAAEEPGASPGSGYEPPPREDGPGDGDGSPGGPPEPWDVAQGLLREGRTQEAIAAVGRAAREARTGRERFLRTFEQAELCRIIGRPAVALPLLEGLARQIDELGLDRWEDPALCGRVVASLYQCLRGRDEARARAAYDRLCQLDIGQALGLGDAPEG